ncbi:PREDICTED: uncharacterized protein LOC106750310 [Dinoponera quadriceps]|uniref:Uncharacterized protein LOC106750310 n=1 Tax=Dinoponera quadriceps TaxID=609295 RepID=A0A6P3Y7P7_DINQU|nr:PREDICTED: uncharacterized protein LOC106750310 [Dinoponera quadriceps]
MCREFRLCLLGGLMLVVSGGFTAAATSEAISPDFETVRTSNAAVLNRLGLSPLEIPDGHHKKRLAGPEPPGFSSQTRIHQPYSRRHDRHRDSHVYIVKLPASPPYYTITKPHKASVRDDEITRTAGGLTLREFLGFHGNGKPAKIYHWNLPVVKKITEKKRLQNQMRIDQARRKFEDMKKRQQQPPVTGKTHDHHADSRPRQKTSPSVAKHVRNNDKRLRYSDGNEDALVERNDLADKTYRLGDSSVHRIRLGDQPHVSSPTNTFALKVKKHRKKAATSYYAPIATKSGSIRKNFPGNGKPKAFYVMEKSHNC